MRAGVAVFARAPVPGGAKRRLVPALGPDGAAELQRRMTERAVAAAVGAGVGAVSLWCAPDCRHPSFRELAARHPLRLRRQRGGDIGERMAAAMRDLLARRPFALLTGSDCPALGAAVLRETAQWLADGADAVLVPALDGGYVLVGLRRFEPALFTRIEWGTGRVLAATRRRLRALGMAWRESAPLPDVDRPPDLARLAPELTAGLPPPAPLAPLWGAGHGLAECC